MARKPDRLVPAISRNSNACKGSSNADDIKIGKTKSAGISSAIATTAYWACASLAPL
jgi:hypothetical protein